MPDSPPFLRPHSIRMVLLGFGSAILLIVVCVGGYLIFARASGCIVFFDFLDDHGLKAGDKVMLNGMQAGRVQSVRTLPVNSEVEITASLDRDIAHHIPSDSRAQIQGSGLSGFISGKTLEIITQPDSIAPPVHPGSHLKGLESEMEKGAWQFGAALQQTGQALGTQMQQMGVAVTRLGEDLQKAIDSPDARKLQQDLNGFVTQLQANGGHAADTIQNAQKNWPELRARMQAEADRLQQAGKTDLADKMNKAEQQLNTSVQQARDKLGSNSMPVPSPTP